MSFSIRRRLLITLLAVVTTAWIVAAVASFLDSQHEIEELFDAELAQSARALLSLSSHELIEEKILGIHRDAMTPDSIDLGSALGHKYEQKLAYQVWINDTYLALRSASAPRIPLANADNGFSDVRIEQHRWRIFAITHDHLPIKVLVGQQYNIRGELAQDIAFRILIPILVTLPILALAIWYGVGHAMKPLNKVARDVANRAPDHLTPIDSRSVPVEAEPLIRSLNALLTRVQSAFDSERRFTADAAHELRTPLAGIRAQAQVALTAAGEPTKDEALNRVIQGIDLAARLMHQLLTLARLDPETKLADTKKLKICDIVESVLVELAPAALEKKIELELRRPCEASLNGSWDALTLLITNLVDNAIRYTPETGHVKLSVVHKDYTIVLSVADSGPGIPIENHSKVFQRFYRLPETRESGSGLGLSIVQRIAELHGAEIKFSTSELAGLNVDIIFPVTENHDQVSIPEETNPFHV